MTTLLLLRHSIPERGGSSPDPGLSAEGLQRAAAVFQNDAFRTVSLVWSSPSLRALQTAQLLGLPVRQDTRLAERRTGDTTGQDASFWKRQYEDPDFKNPDGESFREVSARMADCIVQNLRKHTRRTDSLGEANPLTGKVFCGECGSLMYNHRRKNGRVRVYYTSKGERRESYSKPEDCYACSKHILTRQTYKAACSGHHIRTSALRSIVLECIRKTCSYVQSNPEEFLELYNQISESQNQSHLQELRSRITKAEHRTKDIDALIRKIYEDNIAGRLSDKMLENLLEGYEKEKNELEEEQKDCQQQLDSAEKQADNTNHFIELAKKYTDFSELTPAMVNEFVSKIIVHRPFELNGTRAVQVEVYLNYIGKFDVPEEPIILSEEELATQKIREEKLEKHRIASRKYMAKYRKRLKEMKKAGTILPENLPAETKGEWLYGTSDQLETCMALKLLVDRCQISNPYAAINARVAIERLSPKQYLRFFASLESLKV